MLDEANLSKLLCLDEEPICMHEGFQREVLTVLWDEICYAISHYIMIEGRFKILYYYHFLILNNFRNEDIVSFPYNLLHSIEDNILKI